MPDSDFLAIRPIDAASASEIRLVARRMRDTLIEVLGHDRGTAMYSIDWLDARVRWHLDSSVSTAAVFVAERCAADSVGNNIVGHTIVRLDMDPVRRQPIGLFGTIYVVPSARKCGVAHRLIARGEKWMSEHHMTEFVTVTHENNTPLHKLFAARGYQQVPMPDAFVKLSRRVSQSDSR